VSLLFQIINRPGRESLLSQYRVEVKTAWKYAYIPPYVFTAWCLIKYWQTFTVPIAVAVRSKAWVYGRSLTGIAGSNHAEDIGVCLL
jgi:hypothetical protein